MLQKIINNISTDQKVITVYKVKCILPYADDIDTVGRNLRADKGIYNDKGSIQIKEATE